MLLAPWRRSLWPQCGAWQRLVRGDQYVCQGLVWHVWLGSNQQCGTIFLVLLCQVCLVFGKLYILELVWLGENCCWLYNGADISFWHLVYNLYISDVLRKFRRYDQDHGQVYSELPLLPPKLAADVTSLSGLEDNLSVVDQLSISRALCEFILMLPMAACVSLSGAECWWALGMCRRLRRYLVR